MAVRVSGPAGGVVGAERIAALAGVENAISFDMGGTSTDVCLIAGGRAERSEGREVGGFPIRLPMVDIHTVGAGGGSVVWRDEGGALRGVAGAGLLPLRGRPPRAIGTTRMSDRIVIGVHLDEVAERPVAALRGRQAWRRDARRAGRARGQVVRDCFNPPIGGDEI